MTSMGSDGNHPGGRWSEYVTHMIYIMPTQTLGRRLN